MHLGLFCPTLFGHLNPLTSLGGELRSRGHRVSLVGPARARRWAQRAEIEFVELTGDATLAEADEAAWRALGQRAGLAAMRATGKALAATAELDFACGPAAIERAGIDALVVDQVSPAPACIAERLGMRYVVACDALASHAGDGLPAPPLGWAPARSWMGRARDHVAHRFLHAVFGWAGGAGRSGGIDPLMLVFDGWSRGAAQISQQPAFFELPGARRPSHFHYTAPWHHSHRDENIAFDWSALDARPLIYASLGTLQNRLRHVYAAIAESVRGFDVQMVLALGDAQASLSITPPPNVLVVPFAPQLALLDRAAIAITHAGLNTALECVTRGVPMLCIPITNDQPGVASRVVHLGAGVRLAPRRATAPRIAAALRILLDDPSYRDVGARCRDQLRGVRGVELAAGVIERAMGVGPSSKLLALGS